MKVAIIGAGNVGAQAAQRIAEANLADVVLLDIIAGRAEALGLDISSAASVIGHCRTITGTTNYPEIANSNIVVLTAGQTRKPGQSRESLLSENAQIVKGIALKIREYCPEAIVIVVTNPVDIMTYLVYQHTGFIQRRIMGMSGVSDCARFNLLAARQLNTVSQDVQSVIIGPHADNMLILPRLSTVSGTPLTELLPEDKIEAIVTKTRNFGANIVRLLGKGSAYFGPSAGIYLLVDSIINDRKNILCTCACLDGQYGLRDLSIGTTVKIGSSGLEEIIEVELTAEEKGKFLSAAKTIQELIKKVGV